MGHTFGAPDGMQGLNSSSANRNPEGMQDPNRSSANGHLEVMPGQSNCGEIHYLTSADLVTSLLTRSAIEKIEHLPMRIEQNE